ncbi:adenylyl cyclase-associated protein 1 [Drosophila hydei]|uniref:Adenylyl cyclase-associated protein n=1 Tax=Drosophila hydei TaxID=7224 RepID=A0A6J2SWQ7_DROHY|nr:adenylyl cyclase-associated protein 1 [Drosophila hydei]
MFSCCRATSKTAKKDKDKDKQCKNDANVTNEQLPTDTANEQVTQEEVKANGQVSKPEQQAETQPQPQPESKPAPEPKPEPETQTELAAETEQDSVHIEPPTALEVEAISAVSSSPVQRSTHSSTSTAPPASMTSATEDEPTSIAMPQRQQQQQPVYEPQPANSHPTKSCLSRHNSTHQSIKKKVNISNRAEIIEPDPLNTSLLIHANHNNNNNSSLVDDDDVFSDSLPPPKRESMCAPYIEGELLPETLAFAHGLPAWFDDERLNEIGCIEPPVTPVGRDELELKRQRLYTELLRAAHAAVEHSVAVHNNESESKPTAAVEHLERICERLETLVDRLEHTLIVPQPQSEVINKAVSEPAPLTPASSPTPPPPPPPPALTPTPTTTHSNNMSVAGYEDILAGPCSEYLALSAKIGGDVAQQAQIVKAAFDAQLHYVTLATQIAKPAQAKQMELLQPTSTQISAIQDFREKHRTSAFFNHLSAISESIPALGWVCTSSMPGPYVKEMKDAGQFYTNRVLKEWKEKDDKHVEWARAWIQTLTDMQAYIKQYHTTGLVWSGKGAAPAGGAPPPPPPGGMPPPPPPLDLNALKLDSAGDDRSALFAQINQGADITKNLKKVTGDMQTHKNASLRTGPAPFKTPANTSAPVARSTAPVKEPVFTRDGKKWLIEYQKNIAGLVVDNAEMNNVVYMFRCEGSTLTVKGKVNNIVLDSCKKCSLLFDSVVASVEFVNCQSVQMQVLGSVPTVSIDKTDGCQMYLSKDSLGVEIVSSKSSEMNILLPEANGDYTELALPEQYKTFINGKTLKTVCVDSLG